MAQQLRRYGNGRFVPTVIGDPGPVPRPRIVHYGDRLSKLALDLDENLERAWVELIRRVRASHDMEAVLALQRFQVALEAFHNRPKPRPKL